MKRNRPTRDVVLTNADTRVSRCPRCGAWRYRLVCTGACPVLEVVES